MLSFSSLVTLFIMVFPLVGGLIGYVVIIIYVFVICTSFNGGLRLS